jgi:4-cresol dehydrogenase (hydroxylating) flavoprotein subunit
LFRWGVGPYIVGLFPQNGFGVVTRMSIALARRPECVRVFLFSLASDELLEPACDRIRELLAELPSVIGGVNLMNRHRVLAMTAPYPGADESGSGTLSDLQVEEMGRQYSVLPWTGVITLFGTRGVVNAARDHIRRALNGVASRRLMLGLDHARWLVRFSRLLPGKFGRRLGNTAGTLAKSLELIGGLPNETTLPLAYWQTPDILPSSPANPGRDGCGLLWYAPLVPMKPAAVRQFVEMTRSITKQHRIEPLITLTSVNERIFDCTVPLLFRKADAHARENAQECYGALLETGRKGGIFPYRLNIEAMQVLKSLAPHSAEVARRVRTGVDPLGLIAPGRYQ